MSQIIIDGYNLIRQSPYFSAIEAANFDAGRKALIDALGRYAAVTRHSITVVFDAWKTDRGYRESENLGKVKVVFTRGNETADAFIASMDLPKGVQVIVVSSDREISDSARGRGFLTLMAKEFEKTMAQAMAMGEDERDTEEGREGRISTQKKGPRRRLPKRKRQALSLAAKLPRD